MKFAFENKTADAVMNSVYAAMETGNVERAREVLAATELTDAEIAGIKRSVLLDYATAL